MIKFLSRLFKRNKKLNHINFCYAFNGLESKTISEFLEVDCLDKEFCGIAEVPNSKNVYALFYDMESHICFSQRIECSLRKKILEEKKDKKIGLSFNGFVFDKNGNIVFSKIPDKMPVLTHFFYDKNLKK